MKIKAGSLGTIHTSDSKKRVSVQKDESSQTTASDGVSLSEEGSLLQSIRDAAQGQEPSRMALIEQAKRDLVEGKLGSTEDFEQAINALFLEL